MSLVYRELRVWQQGYALALDVIRLASSGEVGRVFYLRDQICRAALSIPANIAEGNGRSTPLDNASFVDRARGSALELDTLLLMARDLGLVSVERQAALSRELDSLSAQLFRLAQQLRRKRTLESRDRPN